MAAFYADENFPLETVEALRRLGHDILTALEAGQANKSIPDEAVLEFATTAHRVLLTLNRRHFIGLHSRSRGHAGIVVCTEDLDSTRQAAAIDTDSSQSAVPIGRQTRMTGGEPMKTAGRATIDDLYRVPENGKAELVGGEIVRTGPTGGLPGRASAAIYASLRHHEKAAGGGLAYPDNTGFVVDLPHRKSFSPDAAFHADTTATMGFVKGAPVFAAEVRSEGDYGPRADEEIARKRADYFAAGTLVVWDVDLVGENVVRVFRAGSPEPRIYRRGETAEAEPALPGWRMRVDELFE